MYLFSAWILESDCQSLNPGTILSLRSLLGVHQIFYHKMGIIIVPISQDCCENYKVPLKQCMAHGKWSVSINCHMYHDQGVIQIY